MNRLELSRCVYCNAPAAYQVVAGRVRRSLTCTAHTDLPSLDPSYGLVETIARGTYPALELDALAPSTLRREARAP